MLLPGDYEEHLAEQPDKVQARYCNPTFEAPTVAAPIIGGAGHAAPTHRLRSRTISYSRQNRHRPHHHRSGPRSRPPLPDEHN
jgi:hypothetical protein